MSKNVRPLPVRMTFRWLAETIPTVESAEEYDAIVAHLDRLGWFNSPENFRGYLEATLPTPALRRAAGERRRADAALQA